MVERKLEDEVIQIFKHIDADENFLLSGGAGSGKTYSLVSVINEITKREPNSSIACITYTNAAVREIEQRVSGNNLFVSTIHDFLWDNISSFQNELKKLILKLINNPDIKINSPTGEIPYVNNFEDGITYKEHLRIGKGEISHDEVILVAYHMYQEYVKLSDILKDKYDYILVDEYQDTSPYVVKILLDELSKSKKKNIIGFFGDSMQAIYDDGVGDLNNYIKNGSVKEVRKKQNRRNPELVMNLANKIRVDGLEQVASSDKNAPNMENGTVKSGDIKFIYSKAFDMGHIKSLDIFNKWNFKDSKETKELRLTHNLIADEAGFASLMKIYDSDPIIKFKSEFNKFVKKNDIKINEDDTFDNVIDSVPSWIYSNKAKVENRGKTYKEVLLQNIESEKLYEYIKEWPYLKVKRIYFDKDNLISDKKEIDEEKSTQSKRDRLIRHLFKINEVIMLYQTKMYNDFLRKTSYKISKNSDKVEIKAKVDKLVEMKGNTIGEVIEFANNSGLCIKDDKINDFINEEEYLYWRVKQIPYSEFEKLYSYLEGYVPLSTQHKIKGNEFDNVLVFLDSGGWNNYNFNYLFNPEFGQSLKPAAKRDSFNRVLLRTQKLFYVCCTRAKENLVVFCKDPSDEMKSKAIEWFGKDNVIDIDNYKTNKN